MRRIIGAAAILAVVACGRDGRGPRVVSGRQTDLLLLPLRWISRSLYNFARWQQFEATSNFGTWRIADGARLVT